MKTSFSIRLAVSAALALGMAGTALAHGEVNCEAAPKAEWKPQTELQKQLVDQGWKVRQVKTYKNCYEVYGLDDKGAKVEAFFHPKTFDRVQPKS